jgi:glyoxylase-like metal-dependent hydrolase (beta-lactamase superfamily II)
VPHNFVTNVAKPEVIAAAAAASMPPGMVTIPFNPQYINTGSKQILIDTGYGPDFGGPLGHLPVELAAAGINANTIDLVILSHLHPDHINGLKTSDGLPAFPNAEVMVPEKEWEFWMSRDNAAKAALDPMLRAHFANAQQVMAAFKDRIVQYQWGKELAPGVTAIDTHGHTPGHTSFVIASGSSVVLIQSDVTNIPELFLRNPDWHVMFDLDPEAATRTRRKFYDMASSEKALVVGYHFQFPSLGYVEKAGARYRLIPAT